MKRLIIGITGASGSIYSQRLIDVLSQMEDFVLHVVATENGEKVFNYEIGQDLYQWIESLDCKGKIILERNDNLFSAIASGSYKVHGMIVVPCSMGTLGEIAYGISKTLLTRAADVKIKEGRKLILVTRETPLSSIHLENMLKLSKTGVTILPATPGFYHKPQTIEEIVDFLIGKILDYLDIDNTLFEKWKGQS